MRKRHNDGFDHRKKRGTDTRVLSWAKTREEAENEEDMDISNEEDDDLEEEF